MRTGRSAFIIAAAVTSVLSATSFKASAQAPTITDPFVILSNDSANDSNFATGMFYYIQAFDGSSSSGVVAPAISTSPFASTAYGFVRDGTTNESLFTKPEATHPNEIAASVPYSTGLSGPWTFHVSSTSTFSTGTVTLTTTNSLTGVQPMPFVQDMTISPGSSPLTPNISWTAPSSTPGTSINQERITVIDNTDTIQRYNINPFATTAVKPYGTAFSQGQIIYSSGAISNSTSTFTLPAINDNPDNVNNGSPVLQYGHTYSIGITLENTSGPAVPGCGLCNVDTRSTSFFDYTPINPQSLGLPATAVINLPTTVPIPTTSGLYGGPVYSFHAPIVPGGPTYIDPVVADGFLYTAGTGPNFASVDPITDVGNGIYQLWVLEGTQFVEIDSALAVGQTFDFLTNGFADGVSEFELLGLDPNAGLDPTDVTAFVTGLTFTGDGTFTGTMQALTEATAVPLPPTWILVVPGLAGLGFIRRRRHKRRMQSAALA